MGYLTKAHQRLDFNTIKEIT